MKYSEEAGREAASTATAPNQSPAKEVDVAFPKRSTSPAFFAWKTIESYLDAPRDGGCYAVLFNNVVVYIGQSQDLRMRLRMHNIRPQYGPGYFTPWGRHDGDVTIKIKVGRKFGEWLMREARLIRRLQPAMNCQGSIKPRAKNRAGLVN